MEHDKPGVGNSVLTDSQLLNMAMNAKSCSTFPMLYERGWQSGQIRRLYDCRRFAELALVVHLTWWARHDEQQIQRLFKESAFDESTDSADHLPELIQSAQQLLGPECYDPTVRSRNRKQVMRPE